jgi:hypothetical protein
VVVSGFPDTTVEELARAVASVGALYESETAATSS